MQLRQPINISILDPNKYIKENGCLPVSSHQIYEPASTIFHPQGLFSEIIFGQVGSTERLYHRGYIELNTKIFQPEIFNIIISLKAFYHDVIAGKVYAKYDPELKDLVKCNSEEIGASTGYSFFIKNYFKLVFKQTDSLKRKDKLAILDKYKDNLFIDKYLVLPAGVRDVKEENGRLSSEDINKFYLGLLSLSQAMPKGENDNSIFDSLRYNIQIRTVQIYNYIENLITGKGGYTMGKFSARSVALSTRNVITSPPLSDVSSPDDPKYFKADETLMPLFQVSKAFAPLMFHGLKEIFFSHIFNLDSYNVSVIDPKDYLLKYIKITEADKAIFTTTDGINKLINLFRNEDIRHKPVIIKDEQGKMYYLYLVYDLGDKIFYLRNKEDFAEVMQHKSNWNMSNVKYLELLNKYNIPKDKAVFTGSSSIIGHGYKSSNEDLDLIVDPDILQMLIKNYGFVKHEELKVEISNGEQKTTSIYIDPTGKLEVNDSLAFPFATFKDAKEKYSDEIDGYFCEKLELLNKMYLSLDRPKDQNKLKWLKTKVFDYKKLRPLTYFEMFYTVAYKVVNLSYPPKHTTVTRYPILNIFGILPTRIHIQTTEPNRTVELLSTTGELTMLFPRYPVLHANSHDSMSPHPSTLGNYDGDFDGDTTSERSLLSDDANLEIDNFLKQPFSMVNSNGDLNTGLSQCKIGKYTFYNLSKPPKSEKNYL